MDNLHEILSIVLSVIGVIANIVVLCIVLRNRNVRTIPNMLFANFMVAQMFLLISSAIVFVVFINIRSSGKINYTSLTISSAVQVAFIFVTLFSILTVVLDWNLAAYVNHRKSSETFRKFYKIIIAGVWGISLMGCLARVIAEHVLHSDAKAHHFSFLFLYYLIFIVTAAIQIYRLIQICNNRRSECSALLLNLASFWVIMQLPLMLFTTAFHVNVENAVHFNMVGIATQYIAALQPLINLILVFCFRREFQESSRNTFNRSQGDAVKFETHNQPEQYRLNPPNNM